MWPVNKKIRVMVVDDSVLARTMISNGLNASPQIEVVATSFNAQDARAKIDKFQPDVMTLDVEMPGMNGLEFLKQLLPVVPLPVILVSSLDLRVFDALSAGAVDFVRKPEPGQNETFITSLTQKVISAAGAHVRARPGISPVPSAVKAASAPRTPLGGKQPALPAPPLLGNRPMDNIIIGLGASTGGTEATLEVMKRLPADIPPMVIVQHMPKGFTQMYANRLNNLCQMEVREAKNGDELRRGLALAGQVVAHLRGEGGGIGAKGGGPLLVLARGGQHNVQGKVSKPRPPGQLHPLGAFLQGVPPPQKGKAPGVPGLKPQGEAVKAPGPKLPECGKLQVPGVGLQSDFRVR